MNYVVWIMSYEFMLAQLGGGGSFRDQSGVNSGSIRGSGVITGSFQSHSRVISDSFQSLLCAFGAGSAPVQKIHGAGSLHQTPQWRIQAPFST